MRITVLLTLSAALLAQTDPGPRRGPAAAGQPLPGLASGDLAAFEKGRDAFREEENVADGLGPRFNLDSCAGCHSQPALGGSSPVRNPQIPAATRMGAMNRIPGFIRPDGPVRVVRFRRAPNGAPDGGVHALFTITGRSASAVPSSAKSDSSAGEWRSWRPACRQSAADNCWC